jgi:hypothetical protein
MPGFFVLGVFGVWAVGGEEDVGLVVGGGEGEDVEGVGGDYISRKEVDFGGGVGDAVVVEVAFVGVAAVVDGALHLNAEEVAVVVPSVAVRSLRAGPWVAAGYVRAGYQEVVGGAVAAGAGEDESEFGGAELEAEFGPLSAAFGVRDVGGLGGDWSWCVLGGTGSWCVWRLKPPVKFVVGFAARLEAAPFQIGSVSGKSWEIKNAARESRIRLSLL